MARLNTSENITWPGSGADWEIWEKGLVPVTRSTGSAPWCLTESQLLRQSLDSVWDRLTFSPASTAKSSNYFVILYFDSINKEFAVWILNNVIHIAYRIYMALQCCKRKLEAQGQNSARANWASEPDGFGQNDGPEMNLRLQFCNNWYQFV